MATAQTPVETLSGSVKRLVMRDDESGYFVARVTVGNREQTVVGTAPVIHEGEQFDAKGAWVRTNWGPQFKATEMVLSTPSMTDGILKYLSTAIEGIGPGFAKKLVAAFGEDVFDVIEKEPERLAAVKGIGKKRAAACVEAYNEQKAVREIMVFLHQMGLSRNRAKRVFDSYGNDAVEKIKKNPYVLCRDIWGMGFKTADDVARKQGISSDSEYRVRAGIIHILKEASNQGSCGLPVQMVLEKSSELLEVSYDRIEECIDFEIEADGLVKGAAAGTECLFLPSIYEAEKAIAKLLLRQAARPIARPLLDIDDCILHAELGAGITLEDIQRDAVRLALTSQVSVITGGPGTGKSTITRIILEALKEAGLEAALCAPTGKAAKRAAEATGFEAKTLHRTLEIDNKGHFKRTEDNPLDADVLVIDELSMVDVKMFLAIIRAAGPHTRILLIGDEDQIPSVGPGKVLADILASRVIPMVRLRQVFRQAASSDIIRNAHKVNQGDVPEVGWAEGSDFCFTAFAPAEDTDSAKRKCRDQIEAELLRLAQSMYKLGYDPIKDVQVLAPMRRGPLGTLNLNVKLRAILNPHPETELTYGDTTFGTGDKVMQLRNNYDKDVFNGDIGYIATIDVKSRTIAVDYEGRPQVVYKASELDEITLAYAFTIHKSQGSEFAVVIMPLDLGHFTMLKRNLVYTGMTRAKKLMVVVGQKKAMAIAVKNSQIDERYSRLCEWLREMGEAVSAVRDTVEDAAA
jgi:exodeoxyribonuclease V alpha subunit